MPARKCRESNSYLHPQFLLHLHGLHHKDPIPKKSFRMHNLLSAWVTTRASTCLNGYLSFYFAVFRSGFITNSLQLLIGSGLDISSLRIEQISGGLQNGAWAPSSLSVDENSYVDGDSLSRKGRLDHRRKIKKHQFASDDSENLADEVDEERM